MGGGGVVSSRTVRYNGLASTAIDRAERVNRALRGASGTLARATEDAEHALQALRAALTEGEAATADAEGESADISSELAAAKARIATLEAELAAIDAIDAWAHQYGAALCPPGADTYREGMRDAKEQVQRLLSEAARAEVAS